MPSRPLRIGTRGSAMALYQAGLVRDRLRQTHAELAAEDAVELVPIRTTGDRVQTRLLAEIGGKGLFTKEIEEALLDRRIDLAVHSLKDMETHLPAGLEIGTSGCRPIHGRSVPATSSLPPRCRTDSPSQSDGRPGTATGGAGGRLSRRPGQIRSGSLSVRPSARRAAPALSRKISGQRDSSPSHRMIELVRGGSRRGGPRAPAPGFLG